jgi:hypothetical protein
MDSWVCSRSNAVRIGAGWRLTQYCMDMALCWNVQQLLVTAWHSVRT